MAAVRVPPPGNVTLGCNRQTVLSDDGPVGFEPNLTTFRDPGAALSELGQLATWLKQNPAATAALTGSIAHYGPSGPGGLSLARAQAIRTALVGLGVSGGRLTASGTGWGPFPTPASPPDPVSDPLNRRVVVQLNCP